MTSIPAVPAAPTSPIAARAEDGATRLELAVVVPTFNERDNVPRLVAALDRVLAGIVWELIVVDDHSTDGTADRVREMGSVDRRVRVIERIGRRGLSSACIEGLCATSAPVAVVMDGDLQHDERIVPGMLERLRRADAPDIVIGSRFASGGDIGDWDARRVGQSALATRLARLILRADVHDPMSGFFMLRPALARYLAPRLSGLGYKILFDLLTASPDPLRVAEVPYCFRLRTAGESKLDHVVALEYLIALYDRMFGRVVPVRFALFAMVGTFGVAVHMTVLALVLGLLGAGFLLAQSLATATAMTANFFLNNALTYRDQRLRGWRGLSLGFLSFALVCGVGLASNVGVAAFLHSSYGDRWVLPALAGVLVGTVWNFALSSRFTWGRY